MNNRIILSLVALLWTSTLCIGQLKHKVTLGAYYFDGWTGTYPYHITPMLRDSFPERKPRWGWITSTPQIVAKQLREANKIGLSFFCFCWYYSNDNIQYRREPLNNALKIYMNTDQKKIKFSLLVANHKGFEIKKENWAFVCNEWIQYFKHPNYCTIDNQPILSFFSLQTLLDNLGGEAGVKEAFIYLRNKASEEGIGKIKLALCADMTQIQVAEKIGFDILTGYNYHEAGYFTSRNTVIPIDSLITGEKRIWTTLANTTKLTYIPVTTLNWDPRPWADGKNFYTNERRYRGFSPTSVLKSVKGCVDWITENINKTHGWGMIYAWNEYGEGAYLTPTATGNNFLIGLGKALENK